MFTVRSLSHRTASLVLLALLAVGASIVAPQAAQAQARPALTRDTDNPDLAPATFYNYIAMNDRHYLKILTVPAGKRFVIDNVAYGYSALSSSDGILGSVIGTLVNSQVAPRVIIPTNPPHSGGIAAGYPSQDGSFPVRAYFEAGEDVYAFAQNTSADNRGSLFLITTGHYVTP